MSGKTDIILPLRGLVPNDISILRYVVGSTMAMAIAMSFNWNLAYLLPVLSLGYFAPGAKPPTFKQGVLFVGTIVTSSLLTLLFSKVFIEYLWVFIPVHALALLHIFYTNKLNPTNKLFVLLTFLLIPMLAFISIKIAYAVAGSLMITSIVTLLLVWTVHAVIPNVNAPVAPSKPKPAVKPPTPAERFSNATDTLVVVFPVVLVFFFFQWAGALLVLIFISILSMQPSFNIKTGFALILGNLIGGIFAIIMYEVLVVVPQFFFLLILIFLAGLYFAPQLFSAKKAAPLYGMAFSTLLLIIGQATTETSDAGDKVWVRVLQIMVAVIYVVLAFAVLRLFKERKAQSREDKKRTKQLVKNEMR